MKLHEAIELVIRNRGNNISVEEIADIINEENLYVRKDNMPISSTQLQLRIKNYPELFVITDNKVALKDGIIGQLQYLASRIEDFILMDSPNSDRNILMLAGLFYAIRYDEDFLEGALKSSNKGMFLNSNLRKIFSLEYFPQEEQRYLIDRINFLKEPSLESIIVMIYSMYPPNEEITHDTFIAFFQDLIESRQANRGLPILNVEAINLLELFCHNTSSVVYDPFSSSVGMIVPIVRKGENNLQEVNLHGLNLESLLLNKLILLTLGIQRVNLNLTGVVKYGQNEFHDNIISTLPVGQIPRHNMEPLRQIPDLAPYGASSRYEIMALQVIIRELSTNGRAILLVPDSVLTSTDSVLVNLRRDIVENDWLETVVNLPSGKVFKNANFKCSLVILNKSKRYDQKGLVSFFSLLENDIESIESVTHAISTNFVSITINDFESETYKFSVSKSKVKILLESGQEFIKLRELVNVKSVGINIRKNLLNQKSGVPYINIRDLSPEGKMPFFKPNEVGYFITDIDEVPNNKIWHIKNELRAGTILLAKNGAALKPTLIEKDIEGVCSSNIFVLQPREDLIIPTYLLSQFKKDYVLQQVSDSRTGSVIPFLRLSELLEVEIIVPPISEQQKLAHSSLFEYFSQIDNKDLIEVKDSPNINIIGIVKHEFGNLRKPIAEDLKSLKEYFKLKVQSQMTCKIEDTISERPGSRSIFEVFNGMNHLLDEMGNLLDDMQMLIDLENSEITKEHVDINQFFSELLKEYGPQYFNITIKQVRRVDVHFEYLKKVFRNLIENTFKHGYSSKPTDKCIDITVFFDEGGNVIIEFKNFGKGFDEFFSFEDYKTFRSKSGTSKGTGIGGYLANLIIQKHGGQLSLIDKVNIHFQIKLPIQ